MTGELNAGIPVVLMMANKNEQKEGKTKRRTKKGHSHYLVRWPRRLLRFLFIAILLLLFILSLPATQDYIKERVITKLEKDLHTHISAKKFRFSLITGIEFQDFYMEDLSKDTLLAVEDLRVSFQKGFLAMLLKREVAIQNIDLKGATINIRFPKDSTRNNIQFVLDYFKAPKKKNAQKIDLALKNIKLEKVRFRKNDEHSQKKMDAYISSGDIQMDSINLNTNRFAIHSVKLSYPLLSLFKMGTPLPESTQPGSQDTAHTAPHISIQNIDIFQGRFSFDDFSASIARDTTPEWIDFKHPSFSGISIAMQDFDFNHRAFSASVNKIALREKSGFELKKLTAKHILVSPTQTEINDFSISTIPVKENQRGSFLSDRLTLKYRSYEDFKQFKDKVFLKAKLTNSTIAIRDLFYFAKKLRNNKFFIRNKDQLIKINGDFFGKINSPRANNLRLFFLNSSLVGRIKLNDIFNKDHMSINMDVKQLNTDIRTIRALVPNLKLPANIDRLGALKFSGAFDGFLNQFVFYGNLSTDLGLINGDMKLDISAGTENAKYSGQLNVTDFNLKEWFDNPKLGLISFSSAVKKGSGIRLNTAKALLQGTLKRFDFKGYEYQGITIDGKLEKNFFDGRLFSKDPNINLNFVGTIDFTDSIPRYKFKSNVKNLDLFKLHLVKKELHVAGNFDLNLAGNNLKTFVGEANIHDLLIADKAEKYQLDSAIISIDLNSPTQKYIRLNSELAKLEMTGLFDIATLPNALKKTVINKGIRFAKKLKIKPADSLMNTQNIKFSAELKNSQNLPKLLNIRLDSIIGLKVAGTFDNISQKLNINTIVEKVQAGNKLINNTIVDVTGDSSKIKLDAYIFETQLNEKKSIPPVSLKLALHSDTLAFRIKSSNISNVLRNVRFNGYLVPMDDFYQLHFNPSNIHVVHDIWKIDNDNYFRFSKDYVEAKNIRFESNNKVLELTTPTTNSLHLNLKNFDLSFINSLYNYENLQYTGPFVATFEFNDIKHKKELALNMQADTLFINGLSYGRFDLNATMPDFRSPVDVDLNIGEGMLTTTGYVHFSKYPSKWKGQSVSPKTIRLNGKLHRFPFVIMEDIIPKGISETGGDFDGYIKIAGPLNGPEFDGKAHINHAELTIDYLKTHYFIDNQIVNITTNQFDATGSVITDKYGNEARISGGLTHRRFKNFGLNVSINSENFLVLDTKKGDNPLYYGTVFAKAYAAFSGSFEAPSLEVQGTSLKNTQLNLLFTEDQNVDKVKFVRFVSFEKKEEASNQEDEEKGGKGLDIKMNFNITEDARIRLIFDEVAGDIIQARGTGIFDMFYGRSGEFIMKGTYVIVEGEYLFTLMNFVNKPFVIEPGGTITWTGDPMQAVLNLRAVYKGLNVPVYNLIKEELETLQAGTNEIKEAQQPRPVDLELVLTGPMLHPQIQFDITINNLTGRIKNFVNSKLAIMKDNPNELNRQVFGLIVFGEFLPSGNSLGFQESGNIRSGIYSTITEMLSNQFALYINSLLADLIGSSKFYSGTEVDVGINFYQNFGFDIGTDITQRKMFQFSLKNYFFNNRIIVKLGGNVGLGKNVFANSVNDFSGDILVEMVLSENRRFRIQIYNRFEPDYTTTQTRNKTGLGLIYKREFDSLSELFKGVKKHK